MSPPAQRWRARKAAAPGTRPPIRVSAGAPSRGTSLAHSVEPPRRPPGQARPGTETLVTLLQTLICDDGGQGMTEYAILIGTLALGVVVTLLAIGTRLSNVFGSVQTQLNTLPTS